MRDRLQINPLFHPRAFKNGFDFRGKGEAFGAFVVEKRFDAKSIPRDKQRILFFIINREREHAGQRLNAFRTARLILAENHFRVGMRVKGPALALQIFAQLAVIVNLAVKNNPPGLILIMDGLVAGGKVNDLEAAHGKTEVPVTVIPFRVRPAVRHEPVHAFEQGLIRRLIFE